jgi:ABC-type nitrate/sulfonate/bicarbonate transport system permease component
MSEPAGTEVPLTASLPMPATPRRRWRPPFRALRMVALPILVLLLWEALARSGWINTIALPPPSRIWSAAVRDVQNGELPANIIASLLRIALANAVAIAVGVPLGFAMGLSRWCEDVLDGVVNLLRPIPPLAWIPLAILWFGLGESAVVFITGISAFFTILLNTIAGVRGVERSLLRAAQSLGAGRRVLLLRVILPAALPALFTGFRLALGVSWMSIVGAELIAASDGLGYMINYYREMLRPDLIIVGMLVIGGIGFAMDRGLILLEQWLLPWRSGR